MSPPSKCEKNAIVVRNEVLLCSAIDHVTLTFEPQNSTTSSISQGHSLHQVWAHIEFEPDIAVFDLV